MNNDIALTESTYYILLSLFEPQHGYGIMQRTEQLSGGRVKLGETVEEAVLREIREELEIDAAIVRPLWFNQGFFTEDVSDEQFHEICIYFLMDISHTALLSKGEQFVLNENNQRHTFEWLSFDRLKDEYFYPIFLKEKIWDLPETLTILANYN